MGHRMTHSVFRVKRYPKDTENKKKKNAQTLKYINTLYTIRVLRRVHALLRDMHTQIATRSLTCFPCAIKTISMRAFTLNAETHSMQHVVWQCQPSLTDQTKLALHAAGESERDR